MIELIERIEEFKKLEKELNLKIEHSMQDVELLIENNKEHTKDFLDIEFDLGKSKGELSVLKRKIKILQDALDVLENIGA